MSKQQRSTIVGSVVVTRSTVGDINYTTRTVEPSCRAPAATAPPKAGVRRKQGSKSATRWQKLLKILPSISKLVESAAKLAKVFVPSIQ